MVFDIIFVDVFIIFYEYIYFGKVIDYFICYYYNDILVNNIRKAMKRIIVSISAILLMSFLTSYSQVTPEDNATEQEEHINAYHAGIFTGFTTNNKNNETSFTLGLDYEYRMLMTDYYLGLGLLIEGVFANNKESLIGIPIYFHPVGGLKIYIAPGFIFGVEPIESATGETKNNTKSVSNFLFRFGAGYDFHLGMFSISPGVAIDIVRGQTSYVYGLTFGLGL